MSPFTYERLNNRDRSSRGEAFCSEDLILVEDIFGEPNLVIAQKLGAIKLEAPDRVADQIWELRYIRNGTRSQGHGGHPAGFFPGVHIYAEDTSHDKISLGVGGSV